MKSVIKIIKELAANLVVIHRLAIHELITQNKGNFLGIIWLWLNPTIQIAIYAFVFGYGIRKRVPVNGVPFIFWLMTGYIMWSYLNNVVTKAAKSIVKKMNLITKMRFPVSITPAITIVSELYVHLLMLATVAVICIFGGYPVNKYWIYLPYFTFSATVFLYSFSLFNSSLSTMVRDYQHVIYNIMRTLFYITPVLFPLDTMNNSLVIIVKLNPFTYLLEGYRDALIYQQRTTFMSYRWGIYFWGITFFFFVVGAILHVRMRKNLLDFK